MNLILPPSHDSLECNSINIIYKSEKILNGQVIYSFAGHLEKPTSLGHEWATFARYAESKFSPHNWQDLVLTTFNTPLEARGCAREYLRDPLTKKIEEVDISLLPTNHQS